MNIGTASLLRGMYIRSLCDVRYERRYATAPWSDPAPSDLEPQGAPETEITYRHEVHMGLHVRGTYGGTLGMIAIRCEVNGMGLAPVSMAIADTPPMYDIRPVPVQAGAPRAPRQLDEWPDRESD